MMTRAQNETCDVITAAAAAAAAAADVGLSQNQNGEIVTASSSVTTHRQALASPPPTSQGHGLDARRALTDNTVRQSRHVSERYSSSRHTLGGRFDDDTVSRRWLAGRVRNGPHGRTAPPLDKRSSTSCIATSLMTDSSASGAAHLAPLNLTCQTIDRRTTTPHQKNALENSCRVKDTNRDEDWSSLRRSWSAAATDRPTAPINGVLGATQRRSMSAKCDVEERHPAKVRRRTCWSVDNVNDEPKTRPTVARSSYDDLVLSRGRRSDWSPAANSYQQTDVQTTVWHIQNSATEFLHYCNDVMTSTSSTPLHAGLSSSVHGGVHASSESVADRLLIDTAWSRVHQPSHDSDLHPGGASGRDAATRECSMVAQEPGTADDDDDDALRQLLRLIQQPDGQPVFLCRHCDIIYADRMLYVLHMGLHNVNNPWQCNICGTTCSGRQQFALHALHY